MEKDGKLLEKIPKKFIKSYQIVNVDFRIRTGNNCLEIPIAEHPEPVQIDNVGETLPEMKNFNKMLKIEKKGLNDAFCVKAMCIPSRFFLCSRPLAVVPNEIFQQNPI